MPRHWYLRAIQYLAFSQYQYLVFHQYPVASTPHAQVRCLSPIEYRPHTWRKLLLEISSMQCSDIGKIQWIPQLLFYISCTKSSKFLSYSMMVISNKSKPCHHTQIVHSLIPKFEALKLQKLCCCCYRLYATSWTHLQWPNPSNAGHTIWCSWSEMYLLFKAYLSSPENCICSESQILICSGQFHTPYNLRFGTKRQHFTFYGRENIKFIPNLILLSRPFITETMGVFLTHRINVTFCQSNVRVS